MSIRVLHIFPPGFNSRFGGQTIFWKYCFSRWNSAEVEHFVLDDKNHQLVESTKAFSFRYPDAQRMMAQHQRATWIFALFRNLIFYRGRYDLLHVHVLWWGGLLVGPWSSYTGVPALYESVLLDGDTPGGIVGQRLGRLKLRFLRCYRRILAISEFLNEEYRRFGFPRSQIRTLNNCVDSGLFFPTRSREDRQVLREKLDLPQDATILLFVGSLKERKGVDVLIQSFIKASSQCHNLYLLLVGPNRKEENPSVDEALISDFRQLLQANSLTDKVRFTGIIQDRKELAELYRASDVFVFPSRREGLGNVVLEAMASGLPVLVSNLPVLNGIVQHLENGYVVRMGDADDLEKGILSLSGDPSLARRLGDAGRRYAERNHSFGNWQVMLTQIYDELVVNSR